MAVYTIIARMAGDGSTRIRNVATLNVDCDALIPLAAPPEDPRCMRCYDPIERKEVSVDMTAIRAGLDDYGSDEAADSVELGLESSYTYPAPDVPGYPRTEIEDGGTVLWGTITQPLA